jgi:hypothetical protein
MTDKKKVIKLKDKKLKPKGKEQTLDVQDGRMGPKGGFNGRRK